MRFRLTKTTDTLTPSLRRSIAAAKDVRPHLNVLGQVAVQLTKRAFRDSSARPKPWRAKIDGTRATLIKTTTLSRSPRIVRVGRDTVTIGSDRRYAAIHQLGGKIRPRKAKALRIGNLFRASAKIPARPYFPFDHAGRPTRLLNRNAKAALKKSLSLPR